MPNFPLTLIGRTALVTALLAAGAASADPPHARGREFRDWRIDCAVGPCAIRTSLRAADGSELVTVDVVGRGDGAGLALRTPLPLLLPDGATLVIGDDPPRALAWRTCGVAGCVAEAPLDPSLLAALKRERSATVMLTLEDGVRVRLPVSLLGFTAAREALDAAPVSP